MLHRWSLPTEFFFLFCSGPKMRRRFSWSQYIWNPLKRPWLEEGISAPHVLLGRLVERLVKMRMYSKGVMPNVLKLKTIYSLQLSCLHAACHCHVYMQHVILSPWSTGFSYVKMRRKMTCSVDTNQIRVVQKRIKTHPAWADRTMKTSSTRW